MFSSLEAAQCETDKPLGCFHTIRFLKNIGDQVESVENVHNAIRVSITNELYKITSNIELVEHIKDVLASNGEVIEQMRGKLSFRKSVKNQSY